MGVDEREVEEDDEGADKNDKHDKEVKERYRKQYESQRVKKEHSKECD